MRKYGLGASTLNVFGMSLLLGQACGSDSGTHVDGTSEDVSAAQVAAAPTDGPDDSSVCVASVPASAKPKGTGKYGVVVETNSAPGMLDVCARSTSPSEAGRVLFAKSRARRASTNDANRLRKYLARFDLDFARSRG